VASLPPIPKVEGTPLTNCFSSDPQPVNQVSCLPFPALLDDCIQIWSSRQLLVSASFHATKIPIFMMVRSLLLVVLFRLAMRKQLKPALHVPQQPYFSPK